jgi:hypothetical protein
VRKQYKFIIKFQQTWSKKNAVTKTKYDADTRPLFKKAKEITNTKPLLLISYGGQDFHLTGRKEL